MGKTGLSVFSIGLSEGQTWDDMLTMTAKRGDFATILMAFAAQMQNTETLLESATQAATEGNIDATLAALGLVGSIASMREALHPLVKIVHPEMYAIFSDDTLSEKGKQKAMDALLEKEDKAQRDMLEATDK